MNSTNLRVRYRPVRIGWCIRDGNFDDLRRAMRLSHVFRGGIFNPIIPIGAAHAAGTIRKFRVDVLMDIDEAPEIKRFINGIESLPWPLRDSPGLFRNSHGIFQPNFLDVAHVLRRKAEERISDLPFAHQVPLELIETTPSILVQWKDDDPLGDILLATFGGYPKAGDAGADYESLFLSSLVPLQYVAQADQQLPAPYLDKVTPSQVTDNGLIWDRVPGDATIGFYAGRSDNFEDLVNYWNLRVSGIRLLFLDPAHSHRLAQFRDVLCDRISRIQANVRHSDRTIAVWSRSQAVVTDLAFPAELVPYFKEIQGTDILAGSIRPPLHYVSERRVLAAVSEGFDSPSVAFQLPEKPFWIQDEWEDRDRHFVVSVSNISTQSDDPNSFWVPYIPQMNRWLGRKLGLIRNAVRVEENGVGIICPLAEENLEIQSIKKNAIVEYLFKIAGINASPSLPGRIATRLISQLGGLQGCRVLKIGGVRRLIKKYRALQEFDWNEAIREIGRTDTGSGQSGFSEYADLFLESRDMKSKLQPEDAFHFLLDKGVFRVGITMLCPNCDLSFWVHLDEVRTYIDCVYCGSRFNILRQLKRDSWRYRKSGLFGQDDNQEGSIPVALTLQQLDTHLHSSFGPSILSTNLSLTSGVSAIPNCETDLFIATQGVHRMEIAVGECKDAGGKIDLKDAQNMAAVADSFPREIFETYIIFAKTGPFTPEEIENCQRAQKGWTRVILLSSKELEPYHVYEKSSTDFNVSTSPNSLHDMARTTTQIYFQAKLS
jgi:hypothetical protein